VKPCTSQSFISSFNRSSWRAGLSQCIQPPCNLLQMVPGCPLLFLLCFTANVHADTAPGGGAPPSPPPAKTAPAGSAKRSDLVLERANALREAANLLEKAHEAKGRGSRSYAEELFSSAEAIVGPEALSSLALTFREGAPPRFQTPLTRMPADSPPQPVMAGSSDDDEPPRPKPGSLRGVLHHEGKAGSTLAVVTLEQVGGKAKYPSPKRRVMEQRGREFAPHVLVVPVGSTVVFPNFDGVFHNVFSRSQAKPFDLGLYRGGQAREIVFEKEGVVQIGCNLHDNMSGYVVVVSTPNYSVTDAAGNFRFRSLQPGKYRLRVWSERSSTMLVRDVIVKPGGNSIDLSVLADRSSRVTADKFGAPRGKGP
jgi:plastocyanin